MEYIGADRWGRRVPAICDPGDLIYPIYYKDSPKLEKKRGNIINKRDGRAKQIVGVAGGGRRGGVCPAGQPGW